MILVDTSIWVDHFRRSIITLEKALTTMNVVCHPFVVGELACGTLARRSETLRDLSRLPEVQRATDIEVITFIEHHNLMGRGIGLVDVHLLASTLLTPETQLWTHDKRLAVVAHELSIAYSPPDGEEG